VYNFETCINYGLTGIMSRSTGIKRDLRVSKFETYANYYYLNFRSYIGVNGDCYDRFLLRMSEMCESINIVTQVITKLSKFNQTNISKNSQNISNINPHILSNFLSKNILSKSSTINNYSSMESLINHFKF
jgi:NADH:ubiquinone oxidoreductase subunit D